MPADAVVYRAMLDIQTAIQGAITGGSLTGINGANVVIEKTPTDRQRSLPAVVIYHLGEQYPTTGLNDRDDVIYQILVALIAADNQELTANLELYSNWRQNVRRLFHMKRLAPQTTESVICRVTGGVAVEPGAFRANVFLGTLLIACECREVRTQG